MQTAVATPPKVAKPKPPPARKKLRVDRTKTGGEVYENLPWDDYRQLPGEHVTLLKLALESPLQYRHAKEHGLPDKDAFRAGRLCHTASLEPAHLLRDYAQWETEHPDGRKRPRNGGAWEEFQELHADKTIVTPAQMAMATAIRDVVREDAAAGPLLKAPGRNELSLRCKVDGEDRKARVDRLTDRTIVDIKTAFDISPRGFAQAAAKYRYAMQGAWYVDVALACGFELRPFVFEHDESGALICVDGPFKIIAVRNKEPYDVVVYVLPQSAIDLGRAQYKQALEVVRLCKASGKWPGVADGKELSLKLPEWASTSGEDEEVDFTGL